MNYPSFFTGFNSLLNFDHEWDILTPTSNYQRSYGWQETEKDLSIQFDMPGLTKEDLKIEVEAQTLKISGVRETKVNKGVVKRTYSYQTTLPSGVESDQVEAILENGVLTLKAPKVIKSPVKTIQVK